MIRIVLADDHEVVRAGFKMILEQDPDLSVVAEAADGAQACTMIEQPRGEAYYYVRGDGTKNLARVRVRTPTSQNLAGLVRALEGCSLADVPTIILTIDPCISCTER